MFFKNKYFFGGVAIFLAILFFFLGFYWGKKQKPEIVKNEPEESREIRQSGYSFINPLLECEMKSTSPILKSSEIKIKKTIQEEVIAKNPDVSISLYYRDLKNGPAFGINEQSQYSPASLLKVPLLITYYKYAEQDPDILNKEIVFAQPSTEFSQQARPIQKIEVGNSYKVFELLESMIKYSDNEATNLLFQNMNPDDLNRVFSDLGISAPDLYDPNNSISTKDYASFFRILYNASYLNRNMSEQALSLLSKIEYRDGLVAGIPEKMSISHKFGERESLGENKKIIRQLHDCGIVYHPERPYLICVMTKGENFENLTNIISKISSIIYQEVDNRI